MAEVVDDVEIDMGGISKKNRVFVAHISDGWIQLKCFVLMVLNVGKSMVGVNVKVLPICGRGRGTALSSEDGS